MKHSFLLIGQSNMAGRGFPSEVDPIPSDRISVLRNGRWRPMYVPVNPDRVMSGINLAESFAYRYAQENDVDVGLIPCADGGSSLDAWAVGGLLFDHALYTASLAQRTSTIAGVLWHQGESDCDEDRYPYYKEKLLSILDAFCEKLGLEDVPFLLGGLGDWLVNCPASEKYKNYFHVNAALKEVVKARPMTGFVPAEGLGCNPDHLHFSAPALREFGLRYYDVFKTLQKKDKVFVSKVETEPLPQNDIELL